MELESLYPLIVPSSYVTNTTWDLPYYPLPNKKFILTWAQFSGEGTMTYLTRAEYQMLETIHSGWQRVVMENLRHSLTESENLYTHVKLSGDEHRILFLAFMHGDGIGSSRLLLAYEWNQAFPGGYSLALPDRSCGILVPHDVTATELADVKELVNNMHEGATVPMSDQFYPSADFTVPASWTEPMDVSLSQSVLEAITELTSE